MLLVQPFILTSQRGADNSQLERCRCSEGRHHQIEMGRRFQPEKAVTSYRGTTSSQKRSYTSPMGSKTR